MKPELKYGNDEAAGAYDHAHSLELKRCRVCANIGTFDHHFSRNDSENKCYYLCAHHEMQYWGTVTNGHV